MAQIPSTADIRRAAALIVDSAKFAYEMAGGKELFLGGGTVDCDGSPIRTTANGEPEVTFAAYTAPPNGRSAFYRWNPTQPLPMTPGMIGSVLAETLLNGRTERKFRLQVTVAGNDVSEQIGGRVFSARELEGLLIIKIPTEDLDSIEECRQIIHPWVEMAEKEGRYVLFCGETEFPEICALEIPPEMKEGR